MMNFILPGFRPRNNCQDGDMKFFRAIKILTGCGIGQFKQERFYQSPDFWARPHGEGEAAPQILRFIEQMVVKLEIVSPESGDRPVPQPFINLPGFVQRASHSCNSFRNRSTGRPTTLLYEPEISEMIFSPDS